jgi:hypothetical protein
MKRGGLLLLGPNTIKRCLKNAPQKNYEAGDFGYLAGHVGYLRLKGRKRIQNFSKVTSWKASNAKLEDIILLYKMDLGHSMLRTTEVVDTDSNDLPIKCFQNDVCSPELYNRTKIIKSFKAETHLNII